jgi:N6-adenosine-specific RNA methylase IME4
MGRPPLGRRAMSNAAKQKRYRQRDKARAAVVRHGQRLAGLQARAEAQSAAVAASNVAYAASPYADKRFACGMADVPLDFNTYSDKGRSRAPGYGLLSAEAIFKFDHPFARHAGMYFWAWRHASKQCLAIVEAWGFRKASSIYWVKEGARGMGYYGQLDPVEELWICRRGDYVAPMLADGFERIAWILPAEAENSVKPQVFYDEVARLHPHVELVEMFARKRRPGWWAYGDAIEGLIQPPPTPD